MSKLYIEKRFYFKDSGTELFFVKKRGGLRLFSDIKSHFIIVVDENNDILFKIYANVDAKDNTAYMTAE